MCTERRSRKVHRGFIQYSRMLESTQTSLGRRKDNSRYIHTMGYCITTRMKKYGWTKHTVSCRSGKILKRTTVWVVYTTVPQVRRIHPVRSQGSGSPWRRVCHGWRGTCSAGCTGVPLRSSFSVRLGFMPFRQVYTLIKSTFLKYRVLVLFA